ncbi:ABC transporter substrate-binding protein [Nocardiopsis halophila]|uniref:ABC transporter substrate-binding protein n=1 Tax=Nocardiopsis halophila TaxID=141692 RepID=UPI00034C23D3|nr:ABC transporter substrate-binding protein [Nocardiopsis halophila]
MAPSPTPTTTSPPARRPAPAAARRSARAAGAALLPLALLASGCGYLAGEQGGGADPGSAACEPYAQWQDIGGTVEMYGPIREEEGERLRQAWQEFSDCTGIEIAYEGSGDFEAQIQVRVDGGNAPDIAIFPQPGLLARFVDSGDALPLPEGAAGLAEEGWSEDWLSYVEHDGELYGTPQASNVKSLVWYSPAVFSENGYETPQSWDEMIDLSDAMAEDGMKPWCAGIESGEATGWPATDWLENAVLREHGPEVYDQWVEHEIPFDDERIVDALERVDGILRNPDYVNGGHGGVKSIATTSQQDAGLPVNDGECGMYMMGSFYAANWPEDTDISEDGDIYAFNLPAIDEQVGTPIVGGGEFAAAFADRPEVVAVQEYLATVEFADSRASLGRWFSAHRDADLELLENPIDRLSAELLRDPEVVFRWDGGDNMPAAVGAGTFWRGMTDWINGKGTEETLTYIEKSWDD